MLCNRCSPIHDWNCGPRYQWPTILQLEDQQRQTRNQYIMGPELQASLSRVSKTALPRLENQCNESWVQNCKQASASHDVEAARAARARPVARTTLKAAKSCHI